MKERTSILLLCAGLVLGSLTGCGSKKETISENTEPAGEERLAAGLEEAGEEWQGEEEEGGLSGQAEDVAGTEAEAEQRSYLIKETQTYDTGKRYEKQYDANGNILKYIDYDMEGSVYQWEEYEYDANCNLLRDTIYYAYDSEHVYHEEGVYYGWHEYEYDDFGNQTRSAYFSVDSEEPVMDLRIQNEYDADCRLIRRMGQNTDGTSSFNEEYEYDSTGNLVRDASYTDVGVVLTEYDASGRIITDVGPSGGNAYEYDAYDNIVKSAVLDGDGSVLEYEEYRNEYDAAGNLVKYTAYNSDGDVIRWTENEYDTAGNLVKWTKYNPDGDVTNWRENEYDAAGNLVKWTMYDQDGTVCTWEEYEYDALGNLIKETYGSEEFDLFWTREYEYAFF